MENSIVILRISKAIWAYYYVIWPPIPPKKYFNPYRAIYKNTNNDHKFDIQCILRSYGYTQSNLSELNAIKYDYVLYIVYSESMPFWMSTPNPMEISHYYRWGKMWFYWWICNVIGEFMWHCSWMCVTRSQCKYSCDYLEELFTANDAPNHHTNRALWKKVANATTKFKLIHFTCHIIRHIIIFVHQLMQVICWAHETPSEHLLLRKSFSPK